MYFIWFEQVVTKNLKTLHELFDRINDIDTIAFRAAKEVIGEATGLLHPSSRRTASGFCQVVSALCYHKDGCKAVARCSALASLIDILATYVNDVRNPVTRIACTALKNLAANGGSSVVEAILRTNAEELLRTACKTLKTAASLNLHKPDDADDADVADEALRTLLLPKVGYVECLVIMAGHI